MATEKHGRPVYALSTSHRIESYRNPGPTDLFIRDSQLRGFGLRITPENTKSFFVETRDAATGKVRRRVLGRYPVIPLKQARKQALEALRALRNGEGTQDTSDLNLGVIVQRFLEAKAQVLRARSIEDYRMVFYSRCRGQKDLAGQGCFAQWMDRPVRAITGRAIVERYKALCGERGIGTANKAMRVLNGALNYAKATQLGLEYWANPVSVLTITRCRIALKPRTRHISREKLADWLGAVNAESNADIALLFKLMLMTGLRSKEARSLKWTQVDLKRGCLTIESEQAKNHNEVTLPLNSWLIEQLTVKVNTSDTYVFQNNDARSGYITNLKRPLSRIAKESRVIFTPHDLRRTFATYLDTVGAPFGVIKQLLNHKTSADVTERYIQGRGVTELGKYAQAVLELIQSTISG